MEYKRFKDPIYGYIEIEEDIIKAIVDTAAFQRLRDVIQTSYAPLYSSAVHNRFVHSLGVYHLGDIAAKALIKSVGKNIKKQFPDYIKYIEIFKLACLLHDVGHAPFSHTGEKFYLDKGERSKLHQEIVELTEDSDLKREIEDNSYKAAPHELMSVIVSIKKYSKNINKKQRSFFARCILGYKYTVNMDEDKSFRNCLIELLNSKIIDVDKLDYLLRDSYMTGFDTVSIDFLRLLESIRAVKDKNGFYRICYNKSAVSVIENVVYAHDAERKWIQNHPIVLYEIYLLENIMDNIIVNILNNEKIEYELLTEKGVNFKKLGQVRLLGDSDINYLMKNLKKNTLTDEYFNRNLRKHPLWKTEAEFQAIFLGNEQELDYIEQEFNSLRTYLRSQGLPFIINNDALEACKNEVSQLEETMKVAKGIELAKTSVSLAERKEHIGWMQIFEKFAIRENIKFSFLVIYTNQFNSGFRKQEFENIELIFPELLEPCRFGDVTNVLTANKSKREKFFFLYYLRNKSSEIKINELIKDMLTLAGVNRTRKTVGQRLR